MSTQHETIERPFRRTAPLTRGQKKALTTLRYCASESPDGYADLSEISNDAGLSGASINALVRKGRIKADPECPWKFRLLSRQTEGVKS